VLASLPAESLLLKLIQHLSMFEASLLLLRKSKLPALMGAFSEMGQTKKYSLLSLYRCASLLPAERFLRYLRTSTPQHVGHHRASQKTPPQSAASNEQQENLSLPVLCLISFPPRLPQNTEIRSPTVDLHAPRNEDMLYSTQLPYARLVKILQPGLSATKTNPTPALVSLLKSTLHLLMFGAVVAIHSILARGTKM